MAEFSPQRVINLIEHSSSPQAFGSFRVQSKLTQPTGGFVKQTAIYNPTLKGVVTSDKQLFKTKDPNWRPEGYVDLGMQRIKGRGGVMGGEVIGTIPKPKVYNAFSSYFLETMPNKEGVIVQKTDTGIITEIKKPETQYQSEWRQSSSGKVSRQTSTYIPYEVKFDEKGNIISETERAIYEPYEKSGKLIQRSPFESKIKIYGDNKLLSEKQYGTAVTLEKRNTKGEDIQQKSPVFVTELNYGEGIQTIGYMPRAKSIIQGPKPLTESEILRSGGSIQTYGGLTPKTTAQLTKAGYITPRTDVSPLTLGMTPPIKDINISQKTKEGTITFAPSWISQDKSKPYYGQSVNVYGGKIMPDVSLNKKLFLNKTNKIQKMIKRMI